MKAILAVNQNNIIGADNDLLWWIPEDMIWFKEKTIGKTVLMGRNTFESLKMPEGLPNRTNYVLTSDKNFKSPERKVRTVRNWSEVLWVNSLLDVVVIGGATLYNFGLGEGLFDTIFVTQVLQTHPAVAGVRINQPLYEICNSDGADGNWDVEIDSRGWQQSVRGEVFRFVTLRKKVFND